jgi:hypothetical protein
LNTEPKQVILTYINVISNLIDAPALRSTNCVDVMPHSGAGRVPDMSQVVKTDAASAVRPLLSEPIRASQIEAPPVPGLRGTRPRGRHYRGLRGERRRFAGQMTRPP